PAERGAVDVHVAAEEARRVGQVERLAFHLDPRTARQPNALLQPESDAELRRSIERENRDVADLAGGRIEEHLTGEARGVREIVGADRPAARRAHDRPIAPISL